MRKIALISLIGMAALAPAAGEAAKGNSKKSCPDDSICVWKKANFEGKRVVVEGIGVSNKIGNKMNNKASSIKNRFETTIFIYDKRDAEGDARCVGGGDNVEDLAGSYDFDNRVTSSDAPGDPGPCF